MNPFVFVFPGRRKAQVECVNCGAKVALSARWADRWVRLFQKEIPLCDGKPTSYRILHALAAAEHAKAANEGPRGIK